LAKGQYSTGVNLGQGQLCGRGYFSEGLNLAKGYLRIVVIAVMCLKPLCGSSINNFNKWLSCSAELATTGLDRDQRLALQAVLLSVL